MASRVAEDERKGERTEEQFRRNKMTRENEMEGAKKEVRHGLREGKEKHRTIRVGSSM